MSLDACISRWPATTRWPWLAYLLAPAKRLSTDASASLTCRNSGSEPSRPSIRTIQQRVPTLPTPTTLRAMSANSNCSSRYRRSVSSVRRYLAIRPASSDLEALPCHVLGEQLIDRHEQRRVGDDPRPAVHHPGQLGHLLHAVPGARLGQALGHRLALPLLELGFELRPQLVHVHVRVPDIQVGHRGEVAHRLAVAGDGGHDDLTALLAGESVAPGRDFQAGGQPLDVPFPGAGQRLVEVVDVEHQAALGRSEDAEVGQVRVTAGLHGQPGDRRAGQVAGHRQRRAAVVGERGHHHPAPAHRHQLGHTRLRLFFQQRDRVGPVRWRVKLRMAGARHLGPRLLAPGGTLGGRQPADPGVELVPGQAPGRSLGSSHRHDRLLPGPPFPGGPSPRRRRGPTGCPPNPAAAMQRPASPRLGDPAAR